MSWAVTAWPPVGGLGGRIAHKHPHTPSTSTNAHIRRLLSTRTWTHAQKPTHYLNSLDLTLLTTHLPDNSHSDFLRDEKCFRATRRLVCRYSRTQLCLHRKGLNCTPLVSLDFPRSATCQEKARSRSRPRGGYRQGAHLKAFLLRRRYTHRSTCSTYTSTYHTYTYTLHAPRNRRRRRGGKRRERDRGGRRGRHRHRCLTAGLDDAGCVFWWGQRVAP